MSSHDDTGVDVEPGTGGRPSNETFESVMAERIHRRGFMRRAATASALAAVGANAVVGSMAAAASTGGSGSGAGLAARAAGPLTDSLTFAPIAPSGADTVIVPPNYAAGVFLKWGDSLFAGTPDISDADITGNLLSTPALAANQAKQFGYNCDATHYFPIGGASWRGILAVNHEYTEDVVVFADWNGFADRAAFVAAHPESVDFAMNAHGISLVHVKGSGAGWSVVKPSGYNRRITAFTPIRLTGPAAGSDLLQTSDDPTGTLVLGTLNNCAGGATPWGTFLSAEENFDQYFGNYGAYTGSGSADPMVVEAHRRIALPSGPSDRGWEHRFDRFDAAVEPKEALRFGWVVEVDPYKPKSTPKKRTALGRFKHENAACWLAPSNQAVVYSGDDARFEYLYKFVSDGVCNPAVPSSGANLLDAGTLYAAKLEADGTGSWLPLVFGSGPLTAANGFRNQSDVLIMARKAADLLGATPMDRPEDVEVNPSNGRVYMACTNNTSRKAVAGASTQNGRSVESGTDLANPRPSNDWGHIVEITEDGGDHAGTSFEWDIFMLCGDPASATGDLLTTLDGITLPLNEEHTYFGGWADAASLPPIGAPDNVAFDDSGNLWIITDGRQPTGVNNGCFVVPVEGPTRGWLRQFLAGPIAAEVCGCEFTPDGRTLFFAIQHPGETGTVAAPTSHWPGGGSSQPRPSMVAVGRTVKPFHIGA